VSFSTEQILILMFAGVDTLLGVLFLLAFFRTSA